MLAATPRENYAMVATALKAGLRCGELLALRWEDIDFHTGKILVRRSVWRRKISTPKSGKWREVSMSPKLAEALKVHRHLRGPLVFYDERGEILTKEVVKRIRPSACRRAGLREVQWHALRHSFASQLVMDGVPLKAVQELLGHATIEMTMRYSHPSPAMHRDAVSLLDRPASVGTRWAPEGSAVGK